MDFDAQDRQGMEVDHVKSVNVRFVTKIADQNLHLPEKPFVVPAALNRRGLSEIVNQLLKLNPPRAFDFLANDAFLRATIEEHLKQREKVAPDAGAERVCTFISHCYGAYLCAGKCYHSRVSRSPEATSAV